MGKIRVSKEEQIVAYFTEEETGKIETVFNIVKGIVKKRLDGTTPVKPKLARGPRVNKSPSVAGNELLSFTD